MTLHMLLEIRVGIWFYAQLSSPEHTLNAPWEPNATKRHSKVLEPIPARSCPLPDNIKMKFSSVGTGMKSTVRRAQYSGAAQQAHHPYLEQFVLKPSQLHSSPGLCCVRWQLPRKATFCCLEPVYGDRDCTVSRPGKGGHPLDPSAAAVTTGTTLRTH